MTVPLVLLALASIVLGFYGTPAWPAFQKFIEAEPLMFDYVPLFDHPFVRLLLVSSLIVFAGIGLGWWFYGRRPVSSSAAPDPLERLWPNVFTLLRRKFYVDEIYDWAVVGLMAQWALACDWLDLWIISGAVQLLAYISVGIAWLDRLCDEYVVNLGFDDVCARLARSGGVLSRLQNGKIQTYLRWIGLGLALLVLVLIWGCRA